MTAKPSSEIEVYGGPTPNCIRVSIAFEEAEIPYRVVRLDLRHGEHQRIAHLALNPPGKVPTIIDRRRGGEPFVLSQSNARPTILPTPKHSKFTAVEWAIGVLQV